MAAATSTGQAHGVTNSELPIGDLNGYVHPAFAPVASYFGRLFNAGSRGGGALSVRLHGRPVVDVWAGFADLGRSRPWERDTVAICFSTTKGVASTVVHRLADRGLIDYDAPVASYWPEFAAAGKGSITVRQLMSHRAGRAARDQRPGHRDAARRLAASRAAPGPDSARAPHAGPFCQRQRPVYAHAPQGRAHPPLSRGAVCPAFRRALHRSVAVAAEHGDAVGERPSLRPWVGQALCL